MNNGFTEKVYSVIDSDDFDKFVKYNLGFEYESIAENEWNNGSSYASDNVKKSDMESNYNRNYWLPEIEKAIKNKDGRNISHHQILAYCVWKELLPEGNYLIKVSW